MDDYQDNKTCINIFKSTDNLPSKNAFNERIIELINKSERKEIVNFFAY